jgi:hypothetical protein
MRRYFGGDDQIVQEELFDRQVISDIVNGLPAATSQWLVPGCSRYFKLSRGNGEHGIEVNRLNFPTGTGALSLPPSNHAGPCKRSFDLY